MHFRNGLAYRWSKNFLGIWQFGLADTTKRDKGRGFTPGYAGFVMSMSRELYISGRHLSTGGGDRVNFFHSSYLSGGTVMCAGSIAIKNGRVIDIRNDSGHHMRTLDNVLNVLECLRMHGVQLAKAEILDHDGDHVGIA